MIDDGGARAGAISFPVRGVRCIREVTPQDAAAWCALREKLFGEGDHAADIARFFAGTAAEPHAVFVAEAETEAKPERKGAGDSAHLCALAEVSKRQEYVEGVEHYPVAYLEGWYVDPEFRRQGLGARLIQHAAEWARAQGMSQLASDTEAGNEASLHAHKSVGFEVAGTVVHLLKTLD